MLELDDWRALRTDPCSDRARGKGFGEKGMADHLYIRYYDEDSQMGCRVHTVPCCCAELMWIEWKRVNKSGRATKAAAHQNDWHTLERKRGALTLIAGEDFPASIEGFKAFYLASGLNRRMLP
jgi:hypothetical protein